MVLPQMYIRYERGVCLKLQDLVCAHALHSLAYFGHALAQLQLMATCTVNSALPKDTSVAVASASQS